MTAPGTLFASRTSRYAPHGVDNVHLDGGRPRPRDLWPPTYDPVPKARSASVSTAITLMVMIPISLRTTARASRT